MATELKYNGEWLIPLQSGYRVEYPVGGAVRPAAVMVSASYRLTDAAMIRWWWSLYEVNRGTRWAAMLDTAGYIAEHSCVMVAQPEYQGFAGNTAVISLRLQCYPSDPVVTVYATSWPYGLLCYGDRVAASASVLAGGSVITWPITSWTYPVQLEPDGVSGDALATYGGRILGAQSFGDNVSGGAQILSGGALRQPIKDASAGVDSVSGSAQVLSGGALRQPIKDASAGVDSVSGSASIRTGGIIKKTVIPYDISTHDTDRITGVAQILSGGTLL